MVNVVVTGTLDDGVVDARLTGKVARVAVIALRGRGVDADAVKAAVIQEQLEQKFSGLLDNIVVQVSIE